MLIDVTMNGEPVKVRVCDYCRALCIPSGRFCSWRCAVRDIERRERMEKQDQKEFSVDSEEGAE